MSVIASDRRDFESALAHHQAGRLAQAEAVYAQILAGRPDHADALHFLGVLHHQRGENERARELIARSVELKPDAPDYCNNLGIVLRHLRRYDEAIACYRKLLELRPDHADGWNNLANALRLCGRVDESIEACRHAIALNPNLSDAHNNLGIALAERGRLDEAAESYRRALHVRAAFPEALNNLSSVLKQQGKLAEAESACRQAVALRPGYAEAHNALGAVLRLRGQTGEALACLQKAVELKPDLADAWCNLANAFRDLGRQSAAVDLYRQAIELEPGHFEATNNMANALKDQGRLDEAIGAYEGAVKLRPDSAAAHSNLLMCMTYSGRHTPEQVHAAHVEWARRHAEPLSKQITPHANDRDPDRRLKIGYVSPDFRANATAFFIEPVLAHHDRERFEITCYVDVAQPDAVTERLRTLCDRWCDVAGWSDQRLAEQIRGDGVDVLLDLSGHSARNRLLAFARKPAPVQATYLGVVGTTGMEAMDYIVTDHLAGPPEAERFYIEKLIRLPESFWTYLPPAHSPEVNDLPAQRTGRVMFGSLNNFSKVTPEVIALWARIVAAVPGSRLFMKAAALGEAATQDRVRAQFASLGVEPHRIEMEGWSGFDDYLRCLHRVDVALDSFPYNGGTTTLHTLWMGVPVVSLVGQTAVQRMGLSILSNIGLAELAASDPEQYVQTAIALANNLPRLAELRREMRQRLRASSLLDARRFTRDLESAYQEMWRRYA